MLCKCEIRDNQSSNNHRRKNLQKTVLLSPRIFQNRCKGDLVMFHQIDNDGKKSSAEETMDRHYGGGIKDIHQQVVKDLSFAATNAGSLISLEEDPELALLQHRLASLRKRRRQLLSDLKRHEFEEQVIPLSEEMKLDDRRKREFDHFWDASSSYLSSHPQRRHCANVEERKESSLAQRMQTVRKRRRRVGSHRVGGISILPCPSDRNILGIRLDVCVQGQYTQKHVLFFDIVTLVDDEDQQEEKDPDENLQDESNQSYWLRLVRHTLPRMITLPKVIERNFEGPMLHLSEEGLLTENTMNTIQELVGDLYDICYAMAIRRKGVECLQSMERDHKKSDEEKWRCGGIFVDKLVFAESLQCINFKLILKGETKEHALKVDLQYHSETAALPLYVDISVTGNTQAGPEDDLIQTLTEAFRSNPISSSIFNLTYLH